ATTPETTPSLSLSSATIPACPAEAPQWLQYAYEAITTQSLGHEFNELIELFLTLEKGYEYKSSGKGLPAGLDRPKEIAAWIGAGRGRRGGANAHGPPLTPKSAVAFGQAWWDWWRKLQPTFRKVIGLETNAWPRQTARRDAAPALEWVSLRHAGPNGMFIPILALYWWGRGLGVASTGSMNGTAERAWREAVTDVGWIVEGLIAL
ncbi:hypothetical protein DFH09DRAFT_858809, partial [Mycena vulgaris]